MTEGYKKSVKNGFFRMWAFIGGKNEKKKKLEMTAPVRNRPQADDEKSFEIGLIAPPGYSVRQKFEIVNFQSLQQ